MSYSRKYKEIVSEKISKRLEVSYSTDNEGKLNKIQVEIDNRSHTFSGRGSKTIDITAEIPVTVEIEVDTRPFDTQVIKVSVVMAVLAAAAAVQ